jgi:Ca2+-binding RTX toxin-like protein
MPCSPPAAPTPSTVTLSAYTLTANVENGRILATGAANLTGNTLNNVLYAGAGNNVLNGGSGIDTVSYAYGLAGTSGVTVSLAVGTAQATGGSGSDTLTSIENLIGSAYADKLTGNAGANSLGGGAGNDTLDGGAGSDSTTGVTVSLGLPTAQSTRGSGTDLLSGIENLTGSAYSDTLTGDSRTNILTGGRGKDILTGHGGDDVFDFNALSEMGISNATWDVITDFGPGDRINLSTLDANTATPRNDAFAALIDGAAGFTEAGQLKLSGGVLYGNSDVDSDAEFAIELTGVTYLAMSDFIV